MFVNDLGFVDCELQKHKLNNIYSFVHLLDDPVFTHFSNAFPVSNIQYRDRSVCYDKKFIGKDTLSTKHIITAENDSLSWSFETEFQDDIFCFGIAFPMFCDKVWLPDNSLGYNIINYADVWIPPYPDQSNIDVPIVKIQLSDNIFAAVMVDFDHSSHFYKYVDNGQNYLKVGIKSCESLSAKMTIKFIDNDTDLIALYKQYYPQSGKKIDFWKAVFGKIENLYKINVFYDRSIDKWDIIGLQPNPANVVKYSETLWEELNKYPATFFRDSKIKSFYLCENLRFKNGICYAFTVDNHVVLNISPDVAESTRIVAIHHELYHRLERTLPPEQLAKLTQRWSQLGNVGFLLQKALNICFSLYNSEDIRAELFAYMMADFNSIEERSLTDNLLTEAIGVIKDTYPAISFGVKTISYDSQTQRDYSLYGKNIKSEADQQLLSSYGFSVVPQQSSTDVVIVGMKGSGLTLSCSILQSLGIFDYVVSCEAIPEIEWTYDGKRNLMFVVRNPCDVAEIYLRKSKQDIKTTLNLWLAMYERLSKAHLPFIRYEDIITGNMQSFSKVLNNIGRDGRYEFNFDLIDENKTTKYPITSKIDARKILTKRIELHWFGYQSFISELTGDK